MSIDVTVRIFAAYDEELSNYEKGILAALGGTAAAPAPRDIVVNYKEPETTAEAAEEPEETPAPVKRTRAPRAKKTVEPEPAEDTTPAVLENLGEAPDAPDAKAVEEPEETTPEPAKVEAETTPGGLTLREQAVALATEMMGKGQSAKIKDALVSIGATRVGLLEGDQPAAFLAALKG